MNTSLHNEVHNALRRGWHLCPINPRAKRGISGYAGRTSYHLTTHYARDIDAAWLTVDAWFACQPGANIGVDLYASGLLVVDVDTKSGLDVLEPLALEDCPVVRTARGWHLYFLRPAGMNKGGCLYDQAGDKVADVIGGLECHYALLPGSVHPGGHVYEWVISPDDAPLYDAPGALLALVGWDSDTYYGPDDDDEWEG